MPPAWWRGRLAPLTGGTGWRVRPAHLGSIPTTLRIPPFSVGNGSTRRHEPHGLDGRLRSSVDRESRGSAEHGKRALNGDLDLRAGAYRGGVPRTPHDG